MSHFCVLVIGDDPVGQLAPYQENNMDDCPKQFLKFNDIEAEYLKQYKKDSMEKVKMPDGRLLSTWDDEFRVSGIGIGTDTHEVPPHLKKVKVKFTELYPTFEQYMKDHCGYESRDKKKKRYGYWENPNKKWDWHQLGGRWTGFFRLKVPDISGDGVEPDTISRLAKKYDTTVAHIDRLAGLIKKGDVEAADEAERAVPVAGYYNLRRELEQAVKLRYKGAAVGSPGLMTALPKAGRVDQARKRDIDFDAMRAEKAREASERYRRLERLMGGQIKPLKVRWEDWRNSKKYKALEREEFRAIYSGQEAMRLLDKAKKEATDKKDKDFLMWMEYEDYLVPHDDYVAQERDQAISTFAVVKDGKWHERGEMGWFACVSDEKDRGAWNREFAKLLDSVPDDTLLSLYDCHI